MKVLKHGKTYTTKECPYCGAILEYTQKDIRTCSRLDEVFGELHSVYIEKIKCEECNKVIIIKEIVDGERIV